MTEKKLMIYVISDSIGETGELIAKAGIRQFETKNFEIKRFPYHNSVEHIEPVLEEMAENPPSLLIYTNVEKRTREFIATRTKELGIPTVDVMGSPMDRMEEILGYPPLREPGLIRRLDDNYFKKVEAIEFAVKYDDGKDPRGVIKADVCLVGISRTSKTPLSMYLAHKQYKVANIPLVPEIPVPREVFEKDPKKVVGLVANPEKLRSIREERLKALGLGGLGGGAKYSNEQRICEEIAYSKKVMEELGCPVIDVSDKAIEETAEMIISYLKGNPL